MAISPNIYDRDKAAYKENATDGGLDRRVTDIDTQAKLDDVITAIGDIELVLSPELEIKNDLNNPIPVSGPLTDAQLRATPVPVSGTVTANLGTIADVSTETTLSALNTKVTTTANGIKVDGSAVVQPVSVTSLPLPTGAATETTLSLINSKLVSGTDIGDVTINNTGGASAVNIQDGGNSITVDAVNLDIRDLTHTSDTVRLGDGVDLSKISANQELAVSDILDNGGVEGAITVTTTATAARVSGSNLANRKFLTVFNNGNSDIFWGFTNTVTASSGTPLTKLQFISFPVGPNTTVYLIAASGTSNVRITESA